MKTLVFLLLCIFLTALAHSQDTIVFRNGDRVLAGVEKVTDKQVEYKRADNPDGPLYVITIDRIERVQYANGKSDVFQPPVLNAPKEQAYTRIDRMRLANKTLLKGKVLTAIGSVMLGGAAACFIAAGVIYDPSPAILGGLLTGGGIPLTINGAIRIKRGKRELDKLRPMQFEGEVLLRPVQSPLNMANNQGYTAGLRVCLNF